MESKIFSITGLGIILPAEPFVILLIFPAEIGKTGDSWSVATGFAVYNRYTPIYAGYC